MSTRPIPVVFEPIFKRKPWGGRTLATLLNKALPPGQPIGESWELASLPRNESRVRAGPLAGHTLAELVSAWGADLYGAAELIDGRFPLLIKFLDARENLSVQVHPKPPMDDSMPWHPGVKHEAWYVVDADPGAEVFVGVKPGVTIDDLARTANTPEIARLLRRRPAKPGRCFYLPSGIVHALGAGVVVAEVQTPSDVTYRLYDWDRRDAAGKARELHIGQALRQVRTDVADRLVVQAERQTADELATCCIMASCERFVVRQLRIPGGVSREIGHRPMAVWVILSGRGSFLRDRSQCSFDRGDVVLIPAESRGTRLVTGDSCEVLEVQVPITQTAEPT